MNVSEFRKKVKVGQKIIGENWEFIIQQVVKFKLDDGSYYLKCFLNDGFVIADDLNENIFLLVHEVKTNIFEPFPKELEFDNKQFNFLYQAHAIAEESAGKEFFKKGDGERFWDYESADNSYLSLGISDTTKERLDFYGKKITPVEIDLK